MDIEESLLELELVAGYLKYGIAVEVKLVKISLIRNLGNIGLELVGSLHQLGAVFLYDIFELLRKIYLYAILAFKRIIVIIRDTVSIRIISKSGEVFVRTVNLHIAKLPLACGLNHARSAITVLEVDGQPVGRLIGPLGGIGFDFAAKL